MIIGLAGPPEAGKDATGNILALLYGYRRVSFARHLKEEVRAILFGKTRIPRRILREPQFEELLELLRLLRGCDPFVKPTSLPMRKALQLYGVEFRRAEDEDYWVKKTLPEIKDPCVGTDVRFHNEARTFSIRWYIYNPGAEEKAGMYRHASEGNILPQHCDLVIDNSGTLDDLEITVEKTMLALHKAA